MNLSKSLFFLCFLLSTLLHANLIQLDKNLFYEKKGENLFFVMEKVDAANIDIWRNYSQIQEDTSANLRYVLNFPVEHTNQEELKYYKQTVFKLLR